MKQNPLFHLHYSVNLQAYAHGKMSPPDKSVAYATESEL